MSIPSSRRLVRGAMLVVLTALLAAACGQGSDGSGSGGGAAALDGRTFLSTSATGMELVAGTRVSISFDGRAVSVNAGCNTMSGTYELTDGRLLVAQLGTTDMGCDPPRHAQDRAIASLLMLGATVDLTGDELVLRRDAIGLRLTDRRVADPDRPLAGTTWRLDTFVDGQAASSSPIGAEATLRIEGDRLTADTSCNDVRATVTVDGDRLTFTQPRMTAMECPDGRAALDTLLLSFFEGTATFTIEADRLTLTNGNRGLGFHAAD